MNNPSLPHAESWGPLFPGRFRDDKSAVEKFFAENLV
jgi:hypothetical protein